MGKKQDNGNNGIGGSLKNSLSKLTGRVTLKAPSAEELEKAKSTKAKSPSKPKAAPPTPMSAPQGEKSKAAKPSPTNPPTALQQKKQAPAPAQKKSAEAPASMPAATPAAAAPAPAQSAATSSGANQMGNDVNIEGKLRFTDRLVFDGRLKGEVESDGALAIQSQAVVEASILVKSLLVEGKVVGNITASESVRLSPTAVVIGDINTGKLTVEPNASFQGKARIGNPTQTNNPLPAKNTQKEAPAQVAGGSPINGKINGKMPAPSGNESTAPAKAELK